MPSRRLNVPKPPKCQRSTRMLSFRLDPAAPKVLHDLRGSIPMPDFLNVYGPTLGPHGIPM